MAGIRADGVAVYVYRRAAEGVELLQLRRADGEAYAGTWQPVYGGVLEGETAAEAARRELAEETGMAVLRLEQVEHVETFYFRAQDVVLLMPVFAAEVSTDAVPTLDAEHNGFRWVAFQEAPFMWRSQREALRAVEDLFSLPDSMRALLIC